MRMLRILTLLILLFVPLFGLAQTTASLSADEYFNQAAQQYVADKKLDALKSLDKGLRSFPDDARMRKLAEEILKQQQQEQEQQQQQNKDKGNEGEDKEQQDKQDGKDQQEKDKEQQEKEKQEQEKKDQEEKEKQEQEKKQQENGEDQEEKPGQAMPNQLSPEDAQRMLDAMEVEERQVQGRVHEKRFKGTKSTIEKDW